MPTQRAARLRPLQRSSLLQVHVGPLPGRKVDVAIKVQHPNLDEKLAIDMTLLRGVAELSKHFAMLARLRIADTVDQFASNFTLQVPRCTRRTQRTRRAHLLVG